MSEKGHIVSYGLLVRVWVTLVALTGVTIYVASLRLGSLSVLTAIFVATVKVSMVLYYFMHMKYESRTFWAMGLAAVSTLTVIILLTFTDVWFR